MTACPETSSKSTSFALSVSLYLTPKKNRVKLSQISPKSGKGYQKFSKEKTPENRNFPGFLNVSDIKSALGELRRTTGGLEAVFHETEAQFCLILRGFSSFLLFVHQFLNPRFCRPLSDFNPNLFLMCRLLC